MLNDRCRQGVQEILSTVDDNTLLSLAATTTQGLLKNRIVTRQEAVNAILNYSPDVESFLKRKIITRELLFAYLHKHSVPLEATATKTNIVQKVLQFWNVAANSGIITNVADSGSVELLAEQFVTWFYSMMNQNEPLNPVHFYPDAKLTINMANNNETTTERCENNSQEVVHKLFSLKTNYNLYFNPNLSKDGVRGQVDPHGLVMVFVCGTLHSNETCVGVFEQAFALARDPSADNNWKIKGSEINLKSQGGVTGLPALPPC